MKKHTTMILKVIFSLSLILGIGLQMTKQAEAANINVTAAHWAKKIRPTFYPADLPYWQNEGNVHTIDEPVSISPYSEGDQVIYGRTSPYGKVMWRVTTPRYMDNFTSTPNSGIYQNTGIVADKEGYFIMTVPNELKGLSTFWMASKAANNYSNTPITTVTPGPAVVPETAKISLNGPIYDNTTVVTGNVTMTTNLNRIVEIRNVTTNTLLATVNTYANGSYSANIPAQSVGNVIEAKIQGTNIVATQTVQSSPVKPPEKNTAPVFNFDRNPIGLKLNGDQPTNLLAGVTATDKEDGQLTNISVSGTVNMGVRAQNIITYSVTDSGGLTTTASRTYIVGGFIGNTHVLFVEDFVVPATGPGVGQGNLKLAVKQNAKARVEKLHNTTVVSNIKPDIQVPNLDGYSAKQGKYIPTIKTTLDPSINGKVVALVGYENNINGAYAEGGFVRIASLPVKYDILKSSNVNDQINSGNHSQVAGGLITDSDAFAWDSTTRLLLRVNEVPDVSNISYTNSLQTVTYQTINGVTHKNTLQLTKP